MDLALLKKLVRIVEQSGVNEIEVEEEGLRVRISRGQHGMAQAGRELPAAHQAAALPAAPSAAPAPVPPAIPEKKYHEIKSPIVGTFYRSPAPDADSYVEIGHEVQEKSVLCIIEAMKLMNEIESDVAGKIVKILVENGQPVEYNQPLFLIDTM